jgi:hypothetical protein
MQITLTPENSAKIAKHSQLIGWTETDLANCLLTEMLELFADSSSGAFQGFLGRIYYPDRVSAERVLEQVTEIVRTQHEGKLPTSYQGEVREHPVGRFFVTAELIDGHGELSQVC